MVIMDITLIPLRDNVRLPERSTYNSAGLDVFSSETVILKANEISTVNVPCTLGFDASRHSVRVILRSSFGIKKNIRLYDVENEKMLDSVTLAPSENVSLQFLNVGKEDVVLEKGMHFVQFVITAKDEMYEEFSLEPISGSAYDFPFSVGVATYQSGFSNERYLFLKEELHIPVRGAVMVPSGLKAFVKDDAFLRCVVPPGEKRFALANSVAIIDSDYYNNVENEGHMFFKLENRTNRNLRIPAGTPLVDFSSLKFFKAENEVANTTERTGGIGSTSTK